MKALEADGEMLRQLTGEDHGPYFFILEDEIEATSDVLANERPGGELP